MGLFRRGRNVLYNEAKAIISRLEKPIPTLERALRELYEKGVAARRKALEIESSLDRIQDPRMQEQLRKLADRLNARFRDCKEKHGEVSARLEELRARQEGATLMLSLLKDESGILDDGPLTILREAEAKIQSIEHEVEAYLDMLGEGGDTGGK